MAINAASPPMFAAGSKLTPEQFNQLLAKEYTGGMKPADFFQMNYNRSGPSTYADLFGAGYDVLKQRADSTPINDQGYTDANWNLGSLRMTDGSGPEGDGGYRVRYRLNPDGTVGIDENDYTGGYAAQELDEAGTFNLGEFLTKSIIAGSLGVGVSGLFGTAASGGATLAGSAAGGAAAGGLNAAMNGQNILKGALTGGALGGLDNYFGVSSAIKDALGFGTPTVGLDSAADSLESLAADGLGGYAPSEGYQWTPEETLSNLSMPSGMGSNMSFNGAPGAVNAEGIPIGMEIPTGLEGAEIPYTIAPNPALAPAGPNASTLMDIGMGTDSGLVSLPNASTFGNTMEGTGLLGTGLFASGGFTGEGLAAGSVGTGVLAGTTLGGLPTSGAGLVQLANGVLGIGGGVLGLLNADRAGDLAESVAANANPWQTSGGLALADGQLQNLLTNPSQVASRDPSFDLRIQGAQRAMAKYGQGSGAMAVAGANASTDWYNQRLAQLGQLAGAPGNSAAAGQLALAGNNQSNQMLMQALQSIGFGTNQLMGGSSQLPASLLEQLLLRRAA